MQKEIWKPVPGYEGQYEVSNLGRVKSPRGIRTPLQKPEGYLQINLSRKNKVCQHYVHRLVLATFVGPCPKDKECGHLNGKRADNRLSNLAYVTRKENQAHRKLHGTHLVGSQLPWAKLTETKVALIKSFKGKYSCRSVAQKFKVSQTTIKNIWRGDVWCHVE